MAVLLAVGLPAVPSASEEKLPRAPLPVGSATERASTWLDLLEANVEDGGEPLVVVTLERDRRRVEADVDLARQVLGPARFTVLALPGGPLATAFVAESLWEWRLQGDGPTPVEVLGIAPRLSAVLLDVGVVDSVAHLDLGGLTVRHQMVSYMPSRTPFLVRLSPGPLEVRRARAGAEVAALLGAREEVGAVRVLAAGGGSVPPALAGALTGSGLAVPPVEPDTGELAAFWRSPTSVELVVAPVDVPGWWHVCMLRTLHDQLYREPWVCDWCGQWVLSDRARCDFCHQAVTTA